MKKRLLVVMLSLVLVLTGLMPATALAAKPNSNGIVAAGYLSSISDTVLGVNVFPIGNSGRWKVVGREIGGAFTSGIPGPFTLTYDANVDAAQAGTLKGTLVTGGYEIEVKGKSEAATFYGFYPHPVYGSVPLYQVKISGHWEFEEGGEGHGDFTASLVFIPYVAPDGSVHVGLVIPSLSPVILTGSLEEEDD